MGLPSQLAPSAIARRCPGCKTTKALTDYTIRSTGEVASCCKKCQAERTARYRQTHREKYLESKRQARLRWKETKSSAALRKNWDNLTDQEQADAQCGVYCITIGDKFYVGSAVNFNTRMAGHIKFLRAGKHFNRKMQDLFDSVGWFSAEVIELCHPTQLDQLERQYIDQWFGHEDCINGNMQTSSARVFDDTQVQRIRELSKSGRSQSSIAREFGCSQATVSDVINGNGAYRKMVGHGNL